MTRPIQARSGESQNMMTSDISISSTLPNISGRKLSSPRISVVSLLARATSWPVGGSTGCAGRA